MSKIENKKKRFKPRADGRKPFLVQIEIHKVGQVLVLAVDRAEARKIAEDIFDPIDAEEDPTEFSAYELATWPEEGYAKETFHTSTDSEQITLGSMTYTDEELEAFEREAAIDRAQTRLFGKP